MSRGIPVWSSGEVFMGRASRLTLRQGQVQPEMRPIRWGPDLRIIVRWLTDPRIGEPSPRSPEVRGGVLPERPGVSPPTRRGAGGMAAASIPLYESMSDQLAADTAM